MEKIRIAVLGGGSWGTALAHMLSQNGHTVRLFVRHADMAETINIEHINPRYMTEYALHQDLTATSHIDELAQHDVYVLAVPAQTLRVYLREIKEFLPQHCVLVNTAKGLEVSTFMTMREVVMEVLEDKLPQYAILSGPSFAKEVLQGYPTAVVLGTECTGLGQHLRALFSTPNFRCYSGKDVTGIELGGALKNIMAIAVGLCDGLGFGHNSRAALITRSLAEMSRLGIALGADAATFMGLSGMGDLILTTTGDLSRNRQVGLRLGRGESLAHIEASLGMVAEGVKTTEAVHAMIERFDISAPITSTVYKILFKGISAKDCAAELMNRHLREE